ncbi:helix-turn-helix domain-containing protein [Streptacidiphilus sp. MAP5-3]|uniref:AraC family transcriptional regulator n=1 Tax=unclassified Streptacidiphilus TaxID=2643834 RepID=UPI00351921F0
MLEPLNDAMAWVEAHLGDQEGVDAAELARVAMTSEYHLRRMFSALAGMPLSEYVRRRRLTLAGAEVLAGEDTLLDIAVRYGYGSGEAFARAFRAMHGIGPGEARRAGAGAVLRSQPRMTFRLVVEGSSTMQYRIVEKGELAIVGRKATVPQIHAGVNPHIAEMIGRIDAETMARITALSDQEPEGIVSGTLPHDPDNRDEGSLLDYYHAVVTSPERAAAEPDLDAYTVEAGSWAVFTSTGEFPQALQYLWRDVYTEWFPSNPYGHRPAPTLLRVRSNAGMRPEAGAGAVAELWIAVDREEREQREQREEREQG